MLFLLIGSNVYLSSEIVSGRNAISANSSTLERSSESLKASGDTLTENTKALKGNSDALQAGNETLKRNSQTAIKLKLVADMVETFGALKYWWTDLSVSWLNESEENAESTGEAMAELLAKVEKFAPQKVAVIQGHVNIITEKALDRKGVRDF